MTKKDYEKAARIAVNANDPEAGGARFPRGAVRCFDCGAVLSGFRWDGPVRVLAVREVSHA